MQPYIEKFLARKRVKLSPKGLENYKYNLNKFKEIVDKAPQDVEDEDVARFVEIASLKYKPISVANFLRITRTMFIWYGQKGLVDPDVIQVPKVRPEPRTPVTFEEHDALMEVIPENDYPSLQFKLILSLLWDCGPRINEILNVRLEHVGYMEATIPTLKTRNSRRIYWGPETQRLLERYMPIREEIKRSPYLFLGLWNDGRVTDRITAHKVQKDLKTFCTVAMIRPIIPHEYRHSRIQRWIGSGISPHEVILMSGHQNVSSLESYMRLGNDKVKELARKCL